MNITRALGNKKIHFYTRYLSLTLNNTFASLGSDGCLGTLNLKLPKIEDKFNERTYLIFKNKK
jgi:hypothetical protein